MTSAQYQAILTKCNLALPRGGALGGVKSRLSTPTAKQAFSKFVACMRANGINMPAANTSGTGPVFSSKGLAIGTTKFLRAETKCRGDLRGALGPPPATGGAPKGAAAPATESSTTASSTAPSTPQKLSLAANPEGQLKYEQTTLNANAGKVSINFTNMAPENHNVTIASASGAVLGATPTFKGASKTVTLNLKPGSYKFYCTVPGHRPAGMEGTLVVK
jgi:plastocyanin